ncbi:glycosyltransferase family 4 protein [bacterium]|nr:glycosyltransferase family 4 protein [bacterium]MCB2201656.1 glycosyltransferase family 4 protein [bacterium]
MNILVVNWNDLKNPYAGGAEVHLEELLRRLIRFGHSATLLCSGFPGGAEEEVVEGLRIVRRGNRYTFNLHVPFALRRLARRESYDLLIEDINKIPFYTPLYLDMKRLVVIPHLFATTVFHEVNILLATYVYLGERPLIPVYRGCHFNVISRSTADDMVARGIPEEDISIIHCGIDRTRYAYDPSVPKYDHPTVLYLGRIKKYKSVQHLIAAFRLVVDKIPNARLTVVGDGDYVNPLKAQVKQLGLRERVEFPGFVPSADKVDRMRRAHVAVLPSLKEGWGLTNIEANSVGTAVIAADSPGLRDSVRDNVTGYLYEYGNIPVLAEKILHILQNDADRKRLEQGGLEWAETFDWDSAAREFEQVAMHIVEGKL